MSLSTKTNNSKEKKTKTVKTFSTKKLPSIYKKSYTQKKLNKKLLNKLFVDQDKQYISSLFTQSTTNKKGQPLFAIPKDKTFTKIEIKRLKKIKKEIKKQKGRINLFPLLATIIFTVAIALTILLTKNIIAKKIITSTIESITLSRCDIQKVDISFFNATFKVKGIEIANKNEPMKNYVSISSIVFDFDLLQLLKSRFVANELSVTGVELNTKRTYDGTLPPKKAKKIKKQKEKKSKTTDEVNPLIQTLKAKSENSLSNVSSSLTQIFNQYNPETILNTFYENLQTPQISQKIKDEISPLSAKYTDLAKTLETEVNKSKQVLSSIQNINYEQLYKDPIIINSKIDMNDIKELQKAGEKDYFKNPQNVQKIITIIQKLNLKNPDDIKNLVEIKPSEQITQTLNTLSSAYDYTLELQKKTEDYAKDTKSDFTKIQNLSKEVQSVLSKDTKYVQSEIQKLSSFSLQDGTNFLSGTFDTIAYSLLGKYYPYAKKATDYLANMKANKKEKKPKKKTILIKRDVGRTITYTKDNTPSLWIKNISASGTGFSSQINNLTSDMNKIAKATTGNIALTLFGIDHSADFIVDTRKQTESPLVTTSYKASSIPVSLPLSLFNNTPGVPGIEKSNVNVNAKLQLQNDNSFTLEGKSSFSNVELVTTAFEPIFISDIYTNILRQITDMQLNFTTSYSTENNLNLSFESDIDKKLMAALSKEMKNQLSALKTQIEKEVVNKLNELTKNTLGDITSITEIQNKATEYTTYIQNLPKEIESKQSDIQNVVKKKSDETQQQLVDAINEAKKQLQNQVDAELEKKRKELETEASKKAKEQFKKLF